MAAQQAGFKVPCTSISFEQAVKESLVGDGDLPTWALRQFIDVPVDEREKRKGEDVPNK